MLGTLITICHEYLDLLKVIQKYQALGIKT